MDKEKSKLRATKPKLTETQWREHCKAWGQSKSPQKDYCRAHGLPYAKFVSWRSTILREQGLARTSKPARFLPVKCHPADTLNASQTHALKVQLPNGVTLSAANSVSEALLAKAFQLLGVKPC